MKLILTNLESLKMGRLYKYSQSSQAKIRTVKDELQQVCIAALEIANKRKMFCPDFGISHGLRTQKEQLDLFKVGRTYDDVGKDYYITGKTITNCDGVIQRSEHQSGLAVDFYAYVDGKANYEPGNLALIATCFMESADNLGFEFDYGGNFKSLSDGCHFGIKI